MELTQSVFVLKLYAAVVAVLLVAEVHAQPQKFSTEIQQVREIKIFIFDFYVLIKKN